MLRRVRRMVRGFLSSESSLSSCNSSLSSNEVEQRVERDLKEWFQPALHVERTQPIDMLTGAAPHADTTLHGLAFWMVRR